VYQEVIRKERNLEYKGKNVEVVPDIPREVIRRIEKAAEDAHADVTLVEVGGTVGEYQNVIFLEAGRMMKTAHPYDVAFVMVSYIPIPSKIGEMKTKPTQYASRTLNSAGVQADVIIARSELPLDQKRKEKIATFCNLPADHVISAPDVESIYDVPINFMKDNLDDILLKVLRIPNKTKANLREWNTFVQKTKNGKKKVKIAVVGKYFDSGDFVLSDVYISVLEAIKFSAYSQNVKAVLTCINSKDFESKKLKPSVLANYDGVIVPGGFGESGVEGILLAIQYAREHSIPYFGLCYGMQLLVVEYARNVLGWRDAHTTEIAKKTSHPVIDIMKDQTSHMKGGNYGATMRLGAYPAYLTKGSIARRVYGEDVVSERHRHRFEVNPVYIHDIEKAGLVFSGKSKDGVLMEIAELPVSQHPFFLATQFHPEFKARPLHPHKLFTAFIIACKKRTPNRD